MKNYTNPIPMCFIEKSPFNSSAEERLLAIRQLTSAGFKLFIYLDSFVEPKFVYERLNAEKALNTDRNTLNRAFEDLCKNNYLVSEGDKIYKFFYKPAENVSEKG